MNSDSTAIVAMPSGDPFSDSYEVDNENRLRHKTAILKNAVEVPILSPLPHLTAWSPQSSISTHNTTPSPSQTSFDTPITWTNADLNLLLTSQLTFHPPLDTLSSTPSPIHLRLYKTMLTPPSAYAPHLPIGTGRPHNKVLIAQSSKTCPSASHARRSLASHLLSDQSHHTLHASSTTTLYSLQRGMIEMLGVSDAEWCGRWAQLGGRVDGADTLEARVEVYLLGSGREGTGGWVQVVEGARGVDEECRREWAGVYGDAAGFLGRV
ncbi:hypothetical protein EK21DRAFT_98172 [Setomelanomma holmii]|uniref:Uncharacterized protein n=1 Tax=Setomelanomma holmii TaxID=210430 RepID=A0A9P4LQP8_9PLEO|nr:hypothetical protein EK21DRAFT_98172 [Setomelanomma holmii]